MDGHHPHRVERRGRIADDLDLAAIEPVEETLEACGRGPFELERGAQQLLDRSRASAPRPAEQPAPPVERAG